MNSLGSSTKWLSYDSLPSTPTFILSESEHTEDEADVFSEGEGYSSRKKPPVADKEMRSFPQNYLVYPPRPDQLLHSRPQTYEKSTHLCSDSPGATAVRAWSPGDLAFAEKCADLSRFIQPLLELLYGLKAGRFDRGLSSFQQSVAIDRLQRILGILQKPEMGERYLQNLLQIEILLKMWFPHLAFKSTEKPNPNKAPHGAMHRCQSLLHTLPVKKRKLSWSHPEYVGELPAKRCKHGTQWPCQAARSLDTTSTPKSSHTSKTPEETTTTITTAAAAGQECETRTDTLSKASGLCGKRESSPHSPAMQDSSVSSSNTIAITDSR
ncbi:circadian-associated transcriptional repressor-like [Gouania willdenowi]|uniref:Circadian-associated transcriptional repressor-like n=1 Tax=Gouania willdenowi TaxID=441366 RepID=A0A8C5DGJ8_GOUWI|nr:circadian-associated transcriptional repressor-like [Gouania willdenowi]XP_028317765.1 circadian-associated transcriptional repressor-like [Gouania willdenowi]